jgi:CheY-like chemotaxis protein
VNSGTMKLQNAPLDLPGLIEEVAAPTRVLAQEKGLGFEVRAELAGNGRQAVERHRERPYDLILMDCQMPEMDGYEATRVIRQMEGVAGQTPILGVTANAFAEDRERCLAAGMDGHVPKPVSWQALSDAMAGSMEKAGQGPQRAVDGTGRDRLGAGEFAGRAGAASRCQGFA